MGSLDRLLAAQGFVVLDGGLATALEAAGHALDSALWSAKLLIDEPEAIRAVHGAYLEAGADCITTSSYQATLPGFARIGVGAAEGERLLRLSVELAVAARDAFWAEAENREDRLRPLVAASVGPYGAYLADGSEYDGRYALVGASAGGIAGMAVGARARRVDPAALAEFHRRRLEILSGSGTDLLALETLPSLVEIRTLVELLAGLPHPGAWLSFTCRDDECLWDGTPVEEAVAACAPEAGVVAVGVNCTAPEHVAGLIGRMRAASDLPILAYPNSGETYVRSARAWSGRGVGANWLDLVPEWKRAGARIIGGCCRVGPETIRGVRRLMEETSET